MKNFKQAVLCLVVVFAINAYAAETKTETKSTTTTTEAKAPEMALPPGVTAEQMAEAMKLAQPSDAHKKLEPFVGNWNYTVKMWMDPKKKPEMSKGTSENTWVLDGRFLQARAKGESMGGNMPAFEGLGMTGYDNVQKTYTSTWNDNMSTGTMTAKGSFDDKSKTFTEDGSFYCPIEKGEKKFHAVWKIKGKDAYTYTSYMSGKDGKEVKTMEIEYKRAK